MQLTDLNPRWYACGECGTRLGFTFDCPHCRGTAARLGCKIAGCEHQPAGPIWNSAGESFDAITVTPSINAHDHWHGFITKGEIIG